MYKTEKNIVKILFCESNGNHLLLRLNNQFLATNYIV